MLAGHEGLRALHVALVRRFLDAINDSWNVEVMRDLVSDDFRFSIPFAPDWFAVRRDGKDSALAFLDRVRDVMDPENLHDLRVDTLASDPCEVIAEYRSATRMKATSLPYRNQYISRFRVRDGRITAFTEYLDPMRFVIAVGGAVVPPGSMASSR